ncbi:hypothetical protein KC332_g9793 [Hortaea werneckii]|uniref:Kinetochore protein mis14 n=1 Tax=Hortaea werneckii EXF-2000 TaxID=1157616 RepID=A0A1Z5TU92_HORWE|nr:hypothetical protein KC358_g12316 [Hortaea werneckii]OTA39597.1 hypothetical protein BTJ68_00298 [Hortaea werneckii EXF-2000]KAI6821047.1 hypothetical protein KC342_g13322 [Hortaea werneckii]KAI6835427.1 hypothetical protein KC350_g6508 [Hortaea werneckii]KAI6927499.1 hypothetical protein KC341_g12090 [Hortaea werneckii]
MNIFESAFAPQGQRATEAAHRKIELQSPADLTYLIANVSRAAREKIDKHLPPDAAPEGEDAMRKRVEQLVEEYIRNTFNAAKNSMSINGMDSREMDAELAKAQEGEGTVDLTKKPNHLDLTGIAEIEPFDTKLAQRIQNLSAQIEQRTLDLANLRRNAPGETSKRFQHSFAKQTEDNDTRLQKDEQTKLDEARNTHMEIEDMERLDEMQNAWTKGTEQLQELRTGLGSTVARMQKAEKAVGVLEER